MRLHVVVIHEDNKMHLAPLSSAQFVATHSYANVAYIIRSPPRSVCGEISMFEV